MNGMLKTHFVAPCGFQLECSFHKTDVQDEKKSKENSFVRYSYFRVFIWVSFELLSD